MNVPMLNFTGGLQTTTSSFLRKDTQLEFSMNVHTHEEIGSVKKRLGYSQVSTTLGGSVQGIYSYANLANSTQYLFELASGTLSYYNGSSQTNVVSGLNSSAVPVFRVFLDQLFMVGADSSNNYLTTAVVNGTSYSTGAAPILNAPNGRYMELFRNQLYIADLSISGTRHASRFQYSDVPDTSGTTTTWPTTFYEEVETNNGEPIKGLHNNRILNQLLIFKETSLHAWDLSRIRDVGNVGTTSNRSIVTLNFTTYFFNEKGIYSYQGTEPNLLSRPIQKWIDGIDQTTVGNVFAAGFENKLYKLYVGSITVDGTTYTNCEIVYSVNDSTFTIYSYAHTMTCYALHKESSKVRVYAGASSGKVYKMAARNDTQYSDDGTAIAARFSTKFFDLGAPEQRKFSDRVIIFSTRPQTLQGRTRVRGRDWSSYFQINDFESEVSINPENGRFMQFDFAESSTTIPFLLEGMSFNVNQTSASYA